MQIKLKWWLMFGCIYLFLVTLFMQFRIYPIWQILISPTTLAIKISGTNMMILTMLINLALLAITGAIINLAINFVANKLPHKETSTIQTKPITINPGQNM